MNHQWAILLDEFTAKSKETFWNRRGLTSCNRKLLANISLTVVHRGGKVPPSNSPEDIATAQTLSQNKTLPSLGLFASRRHRFNWQL